MSMDPAEVESTLARQQSLKVVNDLSAGVAHEFNNVLQIVRGYVAFAAQSLPEASPLREDLMNAIEATDRAAALSRRLLQVARADPDGPNESDVGDAIDALRLLLRPIIGEDIEIQTHAPDETLFAAVSDRELRQALLNLSVNARDAMPDGGVLRLEAELNRQPPPSGACVQGELPEGDVVCVSVSDTGEGISAETLERIFEPFFTTKPAIEGSGLGLPLVAGTVERAGGAIAVESSPGQGATFRLYLPSTTEDLLVHESEFAGQVE